MFVVDTNILVYAAIRQSHEYSKARAVVERWRRGSTPWFSTWPVFYEFLRVTTHPSVFDSPLSIQEGCSFLAGVLDSPRFGMLVETDRHAAVLAEMADEYPGCAGNLLHDFHTAALMREHGLKEIRTADTDFHQFKFLRVVNPVT